MNAFAAQPASGREDQTEPLGKLRRIIAKRMQFSLQESAQLTLTRVLDVTRLVSLRERLKPTLAVSLNDLILKATASALLTHPDLNASLEGDVVRRHANIDLGMAVSTPEGLMAPVLRGVDRLTIRDLVETREALLNRVRDGTAPMTDLSGSTFTVSNLGASGIEVFTPIINPPEAAILGIGRVYDDPVRLEDDSLGWRRAMVASLTVDHRLIDGGPGAAFLQTLQSVINDADSFE